jgi:hypothetical protein
LRAVVIGRDQERQYSVFVRIRGQLSYSGSTLHS